MPLPIVLLDFCWKLCENAHGGRESRLFAALSLAKANVWPGKEQI